MKLAVTAVQRRLLSTISYKRDAGGDPFAETFGKGPCRQWETSHELSRNRGSTNDEGMDHFWVSRVMDRLPEGAELEVPRRSLSVSQWSQFYDSVKDMHPMPVTQWLEEEGWLHTERRNDPYLTAFRFVNENVYQIFARNRVHFTHGNAHNSMISCRGKLLKNRNTLRFKFSPLPACDRVLDWIVEKAGGRRIVEVQARLGYYTWQLRQIGVENIVAYEEWPDPMWRRGYSNHTDVVNEEADEYLRTDEGAQAVILTVCPDRALDLLETWEGTTVILIGQGAIGGGCDVGERLIAARKGWKLADHHRILNWPLYFEHAYCFERTDTGDKDKSTIAL
ncbi:hypothetical protein DIPPA_33353 [Diplonema papillatum]|nr:hypothetical protein DIPPA_33353 [Diplonema papillatum]